MTESTKKEIMIQVSNVNELDVIFHNVTPVPQIEGGACQIQYKQDFRIAHDYMRAILQTKEFSPRSLSLSALCIQQNPANYTTWHFRRQCLEALQYLQDESIVREELQFTKQMGGSNPKVYQIWYHRRAILQQCITQSQQSEEESFITNLIQSELNYVATVLEEDGKNYHSWSHRQWILQTINKEQLWEQELNFVHTMIQEDIRNNSAWNQRWFVIHRGATLTQIKKNSNNSLSAEIIRQEADYAIEAARLDPWNESCWRYLWGYIQHHSSSDDDDNNLARTYHDEMRQIAQTVVAPHNEDGNAMDCPPLVSTLIDILEHRALREEAIQLCRDMADKYDTIRAKYWAFRIGELEQRC